MPLSNPSTITNTPLTSTTVTASSVSSSTTSNTILAANISRKGATVWNNSTANLNLELGATASLTAYTVKIAAGGYYELPFGYNGVISGIWDAVNGSALVREFL
jgi:hypothetical protein